MKDFLKKQEPFKRGHGILMPVFSLPSPYGIGTVGRPAKQFIDFLNSCGAYMWQILPLGPTGYKNSPYQCFSAFAGNPYLIDPEELSAQGLLTSKEVSEFICPSNGKINYSFLYSTRKKLLKKAFIRFKKGLSHNKEYETFLNKSDFWLDDYALFIAIKEKNKNVSRHFFKEGNTKSNSSLSFESQELSETIEFVKFSEYIFFSQWKALKQYAAKKKIMIVGDLPIYVADDSADVWANPKLFMLDKNALPSLSAGVPPDMFSANGQLWGNPVYNWNNHLSENFNWWKNRIAWQSEFVDIIRLDHFIGFCRYYSVNSCEKTAKNGHWNNAPGKDIIKAFKEIPNIKFIAEDLGEITPQVTKLIKSSGFPGMKVMQFAFSGPNNSNLLHKIPKNSVLYSGTHDNNTLCGFFNSCTPCELQFAKKYLNEKDTSTLASAVIRECFKSTANTIIIPLYDYLELSDEARINTPGSFGENWQWQLLNMPSTKISEKILNLAEIYERENNNAPVI